MKLCRTCTHWRATPKDRNTSLVEVWMRKLCEGHPVQILIAEEDYSADIYTQSNYTCINWEAIAEKREDPCTPSATAS